MISTKINPPRAKQIPKTLSIHGHERVDNYFWMNERDHPDVLAYLEAENEYYKTQTEHTSSFQEKLFQEMKSRIKEDDASVPYKKNGYWYYVRFEKGGDYPIYCRKLGELDADEEVLFNCNEMAKGNSYFHLTGINVSPNNNLVAYGVDTVSRRKYTLYVKDLVTGEVYPSQIESTTGGSIWANDNKTLYYTRKDEKTLRSNQIFKHELGKSSNNDALVYQEDDETFNTYIYKTKSQAYLVIGSSSTLSDEYRILNADTPNDSFELFAPRKRGVEYGLAHFEDHFYLLTNKDQAYNFKLMRTPITQTGYDYWEEVIAHREEVLLEDVDIFKDYLVVTERFQGLNKLRVMRWDEQEDFYVPLKGETYTANTGANPDFDTPVLRYSYSSLTSPAAVFDFNMQAKTTTLMKEQAVLDKSFNKDNYIEERIWAIADEETKIPISLVYKKGLKRDGSTPLLQYAYGSYGHTTDPYFSSNRLSLLDRGFVYAIAHVRGGEYMGRNWYENGKLLHKMNTFTDFISVSKHLIANRYTSEKHLYAYGGSAGGMLMGGVANMAPKLYHGIIAAVPFVDVLTTMLDDSIPLTTGEYDEWGNPNKKEYYDYMKNYSPYDNVKEQDYPHMLITTGYHDSQVQYWEPAKWVAKLRTHKRNTTKLFLNTNMDTGHGGASGRFESLKELAEDYTFLLDLEGINQ
ncbi:S9 family peptidase [Mesonia sp. HuA40]|uniref:S9 family peptidase n=1 Tax=Mesonia sp. HuA40 TaxID=2602761 RepID=UPI0011C7FFD0|nr:S9 family peptidase [Mesonia sp. HuA40]TXK70909.1 S9 family peptidase [Mesonia sp. HuA40]